MRKFTAHKFLSAFVALISICNSAYSSEEFSSCGPLNDGIHYGPYDYRSAAHSRLLMVERVHFTPKVESLKGGQNALTPGQDLNYTLRSFPNHHRALIAVAKLSKKEKKDPPFQMQYTVNCWYLRAERFAPEDAMVKALYGIYLMQRGGNEEGAKKLEEALEMAGENGNIHYNLGLAYFELKEYDKSLASAHKAYLLGFQLPGLRNKLEKAGKWNAPPPVTKPDVNPIQEAASVPGNPPKE